MTAGASGVAFGLVGCAIAGMVIRKIPIMRTNLGGLLIINLVITFAIPGISIGGHIGGLIAGFLCGLVLLRPRRGLAPRGTWSCRSCSAWPASSCRYGPPASGPASSEPAAVDRPRRSASGAGSSQRRDGAAPDPPLTGACEAAGRRRRLAAGQEDLRRTLIRIRVTTRSLDHIAGGAMTSTQSAIRTVS